MNDLVQQELTAVGPKSGALNPNWHGGPAAMACIRCGLTFTVIPSRKNKAVCCSLPCWNELQKERAAARTHRPKLVPKKRTPKPKHWREISCVHCAVRFSTYSFGRMYCSDSCHDKRRSRTLFCVDVTRGAVGHKHTCIQCGTVFFRRNKAGKYCSVSCKKAHRVGENSPRWKGGITPVLAKLRASPEYKAWRTAVFERDDYTCQDCGQVGWTLHAHHIKRFRTDSDLRLLLLNGITLCECCHRKLRGKEEFHEKRLFRKLAKAERLKAERNERAQMLQQVLVLEGVQP